MALIGLSSPAVLQGVLFLIASEYGGFRNTFSGLAVGRLVDRILKAQDSGANTDTGTPEAKIGLLNYGPYGLTEGEIAAVKNY